MFIRNFFESFGKPGVVGMIGSFLWMAIGDTKYNIGSFGVDYFNEFALKFIEIVMMLYIEILPVFVLDVRAYIETTTTFESSARESIVLLVVFHDFRDKFVFVAGGIPGFCKCYDVEGKDEINTESF